MAAKPDLPAQIGQRCFIWKPDRCTEAQKKADQRLIEAIARKAPRDQAAKAITKKAWDYYLKEKDPVTALYRFNQALILDPKLGEAWWGAGTVLVEQGLGSDGQPLLTKGIGLDRLRPEPHMTLGRYYFLQRKDPPNAALEFAAAIKLNPSLAEGHLWLARVWVIQKKREDSARSYQKARELGAPVDPDLEERLGLKK
jgi:Tfp pilus assembly protein PilF